MIQFSPSKTARIVSASWSMSQSAYTSPVVWIDAWPSSFCVAFRFPVASRIIWDRATIQGGTARGRSGRGRVRSPFVDPRLCQVTPWSLNVVWASTASTGDDAVLRPLRAIPLKRERG